MRFSRGRRPGTEMPSPMNENLRVPPASAFPTSPLRVGLSLKNTPLLADSLGVGGGLGESSSSNAPKGAVVAISGTPQAYIRPKISPTIPHPDASCPASEAAVARPLTVRSPGGRCLPVLVLAYPPSVLQLRSAPDAGRVIDLVARQKVRILDYGYDELARMVSWSGISSLGSTTPWW
jgi:hypothetical protein